MKDRLAGPFGKLYMVTYFGTAGGLDGKGPRFLVGTRPRRRDNA